MSKTFLEMGRRVAIKTRLDSPVSLFGNTADDAVLIRACLQEAALLDVMRAEDWEILRKRHTFKFTADEDEYDLPVYFDRIVNDTVWDLENSFPMTGPLNAQQWEFLQSGLAVTSGITKCFTIMRATGLDQTKKIMAIYPDPTPPAVGGITGSNLILNPGFETAGGGDPDFFADWSESAGDGSISRASVVDFVHSGAWTSVVTAGVTFNSHLYQQISVLGSTPYRFSFYSMNTGGVRGTGPYYQVYDNSNGSDIVVSVGTSYASSYALTTVDFTTPYGCTSINVYLRSVKEDGVLSFFDTVSLYKLSVEDGVAYQYISSQYIYDDDDDLFTEFTLDGQYTMLDDEVVIAGAVVRVLESLGMDYVEQQDRFEALRDDRIAKDGGAPTVNMAGPSNMHLGYNIPETGYG